ncbi:MAG: nickel pincer cofactor biosynthesis protein LarC [Clostridiales bacterium]|nr:nickel pincer cofactor biosynthesis protein LarC [Clostridiales bacterium]
MDNKNQTLYLECCSGISGDMTVAALLDLGADQEALERAVRSLPVEGFRLEITRVKKAGLDMCDFNVILDEEHENHDHDMEYLHGHAHTHEAEHAHAHVHTHEGEHGHAHAHTHAHRGLAEILHIIDHAELTDRAKQTAVRIFRILAEAEAKAHGVPEDQVHFHEVGAVDSIVDIVAAAVCLDNLDITEVIVPKLCEGHGTIRCQHGVIPVPVPAAANIVQRYQIPLTITGTAGELVTPTGAAIAAAVRTSGKLPEVFTVERLGMGAGKRDYDCPGMLRAMLIRTGEERADQDLIYKLETNIDDCSGESLGYCLDRLMEAGARDVHYTPVYMKKNRPAYQLNVICTEEDIQRMEKIIFEETSTIGIRRVPMERTVLGRKACTVQTPLGEAQVKVCRLQGTDRYFPEYNSIIKLCREHRRNYQEVYQIIQRACESLHD